MINHSQDIDKAIAAFPEGLRSTLGKIWIIDNSLMYKTGKACNYGWHYGTTSHYKGIKGSVNASGMKDSKGMHWYMIQSRGWHHDAKHVDYSQICILISRQCWVNGKEMDIIDVLQNPELAFLANHDGVLKVLRQPNVPILDPIVELPVQREVREVREVQEVNKESISEVEIPEESVNKGILSIWNIIKIFQDLLKRK
jgi:hypothetical protein